MAALADISELTTLQNERGCRLGDQCGEQFGRQLVDSAAHDFHRGGEPKMKKHMTRLCGRLVGVSCCKLQLARTEGAANVVRYGLVVLSFTFLLPASAQDRSNRIFDQFTGRYHCGGRWTEFQFKIVPVTGPLGLDEPGGGVTGAFTFLFHRSLTSTDGAGYTLAGHYDPKTGRFHLDPKPWAAPHPAALEAIGIEGTFDAETRKMTAKMLSDKCDAVELVPRGVTLPALPAGAAYNAPARDPKRIEMMLGPTNVTNSLDVSANSPGFEYLVTAWYDPPDTLHDGGPIDESVAGMKKEKFACVGSQHVTWDATGTKGTASDRVTLSERFVVECVGDCKGVFYRPEAGAQVIHFGLTQPLPTMQIKSVWLGGTSFRWKFTRTNNSQPPPEIYVHHWKPLTGAGPFDGRPADIARQQAEAPQCKAPQASKR